MESHSRSGHVDAIVIGAGAAGVAAARMLQDYGQSVLVLEARDRIGGRIHTDYDWADHPIELGAEFIHGEVVTWEMLRQFGMDAFPVLEESQAYLHTPKGSRLRHPEQPLPTNEQIAFDLLESNESSIWDWVDAWIAAGKPDTDLATMLRLSDVVIPPDLHRVIDNSYSSDYGVYLHQLGVYGVAESTYEGDGANEYRIAEGYSKLLDRLATGLNIKLSSPVTQIEWAGDLAIVKTATEQFTTDRVIITLPLALLQRNTVTFIPELPNWKQKAIQGLGLTHIIKLILKFDRPFWPENWEYCVTHLDSQLWWRPGAGRDNEAPIITAFVGSDGADRIRALGETEAAKLGVKHLEEIFDVDLTDRLIDAKLIDWQTEPYSQMGYTYTPVNGTGLRQKLGESLHDRLFFAGEATSVLRPSTVHGAFETGFRAAQEILLNLKTSAGTSAPLSRA
jgi:monoamine oxidase